MASPRTRHASGERQMHYSADDNAIMKHILATHSPDGTNFDVMPLLQIIEEMHRADPYTSHQENQAELEVRVEGVISNDVSATLEVLGLTINKVSCEISYKCIGGEDPYVTTIGIFNMLSKYGWDAKATITLAAFAVIYGEFILVARHYTDNPLAKSLAHLKELPDVSEHKGTLKPRFDAISMLITAILDLTHCIAGFTELLEEYTSSETPVLVIATTHIPSAVYWIIRSIVACASTLVNLIGMGHKHIAMIDEARDISSFVPMINNIQNRLLHQFDLQNQYINEKKQTEAYQMITRIMDTPHLDNLKPLKHLIYLKDDLLPLYKSSTKKLVGIDILKKKTALLLISDLDLPPEELSVLDQNYREARHNPTRAESQYEVVWLPVVPNHKTKPWTDEDQIKFEALRNTMPWYSMSRLSLLEPAVIKYIKEVWHFNDKLLLVVMDPQGRIVNTNAFHMMLIWGIRAFPFTSQREEALWMEENWRMELLVDSVEPTIFNWISERRYICLYGGEDIKWIRKFTNAAKAVAQAAEIPLEMLYVGKSNPMEKVQKNIDTIQVEKLSYVLPDLTHIWFLWVRLVSMLNSKLQFGKSFDEDPILREIGVMLDYDSDGQGWAVICCGSNDWMRRTNGDTVLKSLINYKDWADQVQERGFLAALNDHLEANRPKLHCTRLILPRTTESQGRVKFFKGLKRILRIKSCDKANS